MTINFNEAQTLHDKKMNNTEIEEALNELEMSRGLKRRKV
jgi:hypothetical protein